MKKIITLIVLIILVWAFIEYGQKSKNTLEEVQNTDDTSMMEVFDMTTLLDGVYVADVASSTIFWEGKKKILTNWIDRGSIRFEKAEGTILGGKISNAVFTINMNSITALSTGKGDGQDRLSGHLKSPDFFDVAKFPTSTFKIVSVEIVEKEIIVTGDLTIKGTVNQIKFPVKVERSGDSYIVKGKVALDRTLWNVRYGSDKFFDNLGDNVIDDMFTVEFSVVGKKS